MISIVTAVYNGASSIADCLQSVASQTYSEVEHLILDGASSDRTTDVVRDFGGEQVRLISEADDGLYDALNKGVRLAEHDIVGLLHADDLLGSDSVLSAVANAFAEDANLEAVYGDLLYVDAEDTSKVVRYWKAGQYSRGRFLQGWMPPHPTLFLRKSAYERVGPFKTHLNISADYEFMLRGFHVHGFKAQYLPQVITRMRLGGMSNRNLKNIATKTRQDLEAWHLNGMTRFAVPAVLLKNISKLPQFFIRP